ncbi:hypothetical protein ACIQLK_05735 [Microbacterium sp. NPDC091382]|uniref:hypothetical protein n=1 Tax=Microbacterium sp. NPDC091382 TaxID=3364210 RepID=UPI00381762B2
MRTSQLLGESFRNVRSGTTRALLGVVALFSILLGTVASDGLAASDIFSSQRAVRASGASVVTVSALGGIDGERCASLARVHGVVGAFALREAPARLTLDAMPDTSFALYETTGDPVAVLGGRSTSDGLLMSSQISTLLAAADRPLLSVANEVEPVRVDGVFNYPDDGRNSQLAAAFLASTAASGAFDSCWFSLWPPSEELAGLASLVVMPGVDASSVSIGQLNQTFGRATTTDELMQTRTTRYLPPAGALLAFVLTFLMIRSRRVELSVARHLGQSARGQVGQLLIETATWALVTTLAAFAVMTPFATASLTAREVEWVLEVLTLNVAVVFLFSLIGATAATLTISSRRMQSWSKDR